MRPSSGLTAAARLRGGADSSGVVVSYRRLRVLGLTAGLACLAALVPGPVGAVPSGGVGDRLDPDPGALTVRGKCAGGGRMKVTARAQTDAGTYPVEIDVRNVPAGSSWRGSLGTEYRPGGDEVRQRFEAVAGADGTWSYETEVDARDGKQAIFFADAFSRQADRFCSIWAYPLRRFQGGLAFGRPRVITATTLSRNDAGDLVVRFFALPFRDDVAGERWQVDFRVSDADGSQQVTVQDEVGKRGLLRARAVLSGIDDPRVYVEATDAKGRPSSMGVNASVVTEAPPAPPSVVRREMRQLAG